MPIISCVLYINSIIPSYAIIPFFISAVILSQNIVRDIFALPFTFPKRGKDTPSKDEESTAEDTTSSIMNTFDHLMMLFYMAIVKFLLWGIWTTVR